jgi:hypothetical protein
VFLPTIHNLVGAKEQHGADGRLIELADAEGAQNARLGSQGIFQRQVNLRQTPMDQSDIDLHEEEEAGERAALAKAWLGFLGPGDDAPNQALILRERPPAFGDVGEIRANHDLGGRAGIKRDEGGVTILAVSISLPNSIPAFA